MWLEGRVVTQFCESEIAVTNEEAEMLASTYVNVNSYNNF